VVLAVHHAQLLSYLGLANKPLGLFINVNDNVLVEGVKRIMNGFAAPPLPRQAVDTNTSAPCFRRLRDSVPPC
jgi:hypothetical protein